MKKLLFSCLLWLLPMLTWAAAGDVWLYPPNLTVMRDAAFTLQLIVNSGSVKVGAYKFVATFDATKLRLDTTYQDASGQCSQGVCPGSNTLTNRINSVDATGSTLTLIGSDSQGVGPGSNLQLLSLHFRSKLTLGTTPINLSTTALTATSGATIGLGAYGATVTISYGICGDANGNRIVNVVDALAINRYVVGLPPPPSVNSFLADVNMDGRVSISDAIHIARYYVGLVISAINACAIGQPL